MNSYNTDYLEDAMHCFGEMLEYVVEECRIDADMFFDMFISSGFAKRFENGDFTLFSGMSGSELVQKAAFESGLSLAFPEAIRDYEGYSLKYQSGMLLAYIQWFSGRKFSQILKIPKEEVDRRAGGFAEMEDAERAAIAAELMPMLEDQTNIQKQRKLCGLSQRELAQRSGVNVRTLQQYEIKTKDINKAAGVTLLSLAKALGCEIEDIIEY